MVIINNKINKLSAKITKNYKIALTQKKYLDAVLLHV